MKFYLVLLVFSLALFNVSYGDNLAKTYKQADALLKSGEFEKSKDLLTKIIEKDSNYKDVFYLRGYAELMLQEFDEAIKDYNIAIQKKQHIADAYNERGLASGYVGELDSAISDFNKAIDLDPKFPQPYINLASVFLNAGDTTTAMAKYNIALGYDKNLPEVYYQIGKIRYKGASYKDAILQFEKSMKIGYDKAEGLYQIGNCYFKMGDFNRSVKYFTDAIKLDKTKYDAFNNRAVAFDTLGQKDLADKDRDFLNKISDNKFLDKSKLDYTNYVAPDSSFKIKLPVNWTVKSSFMKDELFMTITPDAKYISGIPRYALVTIRFNKKMFEQYNVLETDSIISFWKGSNFENTKTYNRYEIYQELHYKINGMDAVRFNTLMQPIPSVPSLRQYELLLPRKGELFYAYFQCPAKQFEYYNEIFTKAMDSIQFYK